MSLEESRAEGIDVESRRETAVAGIAGLFDGSVAGGAQSDRGTRLRLAVVGKLLRQTEIDKASGASGFAHYVFRLDVEMEHLPGMHIGHRATDLCNNIQSLMLGNRAALAYVIVEVAAVDILHRIVGRVVLIEHVEDSDNIAVLEASEVFGLFAELTAIIGKHRA